MIWTFLFFCIVTHLAEVPAQGGDLDLADVDAVDQDLALLELVVPADQGEGMLAVLAGTPQGMASLVYYIPSPAILRTKEVLTRMAAGDSPVLLMGETGTGKELLAHALHRASPRRDGPFVAINVAAFPENLLESELFGYEEGAFTGARKGGRPGLFELAHQGTLFLDEVEGMSPALQVKMLRVLQEREIMRVGGSRIVSVDVRIVAATNEDLSVAVC